MMKVTTPMLDDAQRSRIRITIAGVGNSWTLMIFYALGNAAQGSLRYMEIKRAIVTVSQRSLTQALRDLERDGYVARKVYPSSPPKVEYRLTPLGRSLLKTMNGLVLWTEAHFGEVLAARKRYDQSADLEKV